MNIAEDAATFLGKGPSGQMNPCYGDGYFDAACCRQYGELAWAEACRLAHSSPHKAETALGGGTGTPATIAPPVAPPVAPVVGPAAQTAAAFSALLIAVAQCSEEEQRIVANALDALTTFLRTFTSARQANK